MKEQPLCLVTHEVNPIYHQCDISSDNTSFRCNNPRYPILIYMTHPWSSFQSQARATLQDSQLIQVFFKHNLVDANVYRIIEERGSCSMSLPSSRACMRNLGLRRCAPLCCMSSYRYIYILCAIYNREREREQNIIDSFIIHDEASFDLWDQINISSCM